MSATNPVIIKESENLTDPIEVPLSDLSAQGNWEITATTVDANGDSVTGDGTANVDVMTVPGIAYEPLYQQDGTTQEQFDFSAADRTIVVWDTPCKKVRLTPSGATLGDHFRVAVYEAS